MSTDTPLHELSLRRHIAAPPAAVYRCWTEADLIKQWFCPAPWTVASADVQARPGGRSRILMRGPNGEEHLSQGVFLELVPNERIVSTDAYTEGWVPAKPFMTIIIQLYETESGETSYHARVRHWSEADKLQHEQMGFEAGWGKATDQLEALAKTL